MENLKYWEREIPKVKILGRVRIAYYEHAGALQFSLMNQAADGSLAVGKTVILYEDYVTRETLPAIEFLMDVLHMWRKRGRARNPANMRNIALVELQALVSAERIDQGNFITEPAGDPGGVDTLQDQAGEVAEDAAVDTTAAEAEPVPLTVLDGAEGGGENTEGGDSSSIS